MQVGDTARYCLTDSNAWEVGVGTYAAGNTLARTSIEANSNDNAAISLSGSASQAVFLTASAAQLVPTLGGRHYLIGALVSGASGTLPRLDVYTTSGSYTWTKQASAALVDIMLIGAGGVGTAMTGPGGVGSIASGATTFGPMSAYGSLGGLTGTATCDLGGGFISTGGGTAGKNGDLGGAESSAPSSAISRSGTAFGGVVARSPVVPAAGVGANGSNASPVSWNYTVEASDGLGGAASSGNAGSAGTGSGHGAGGSGGSSYLLGGPSTAPPRPRPPRASRTTGRWRSRTAAAWSWRRRPASRKPGRRTSALPRSLRRQAQARPASLRMRRRWGGPPRQRGHGRRRAVRDGFRSPGGP